MPRATRVTIDVDEYYAHCDENDGFCITCNDWTNIGVEPDAHEYTCDVCGEPTVYGTEEAMIMGLLDIHEW